MRSNVKKGDGYNDLGQFDNNKERRKRRIIWGMGFAGFVLAMVAMGLIVPRSHEPPTPEEYLLGLFPTNFTGFEPIQKAEVELHASTDSGNVEYAVAYYKARERYSEELLGIELRVDRHSTESGARLRVGGPHISLDWGFEGIDLEWLVAGHTRELPGSGGDVAVDICTWIGLYGPLQGARFYSWVRDEYRFQLTLVGDPAYIMSDEGESHLVSAWEDTHRRWGRESR